MPRTINLYIFKEISVPFLLSVFILTITALLSKIMRIVEMMVTHGLGPGFVLRFIASAVPSFLIYVIPISFLIGVLVAFTRLSSDSEIIAMKASGLSLFSLFRPVLLAALISYLATLACTLYLFPWGNINTKRLLFEAAKSRLFSGIEEKTFYDRFKGVVLYIDRLSPKTGELEGIFISQENPGAEPTIFFAEKGVFEPSEEKFTVFLKLFSGSVHRKTEKGDAYHLADFSSYLIELSLTNNGPSANTADRANRELYVKDLVKREQALKESGQSAAPVIIDLHKRFALPASVFVFSLLGVPFGIQKIRSARFAGFSIALGLVLAYYVTSTALEALGENGVLNPVFAVWGSDVLFGAAGAWLFYRTAKDSPVDFTAWAQRAASLIRRRPA